MLLAQSMQFVNIVLFGIYLGFGLVLGATLACILISSVNCIESFVVSSFRHWRSMSKWAQ